MGPQVLGWRRRERLVKPPINLDSSTCKVHLANRVPSVTSAELEKSNATRLHHVQIAVHPIKVRLLLSHLWQANLVNRFLKQRVKRLGK
jgi:hypothetical protein